MFQHTPKEQAASILSSPQPISEKISVLAELCTATARKDYPTAEHIAQQCYSLIAQDSQPQNTMIGYYLQAYFLSDKGKFQEANRLLAKAYRIGIRHHLEHRSISCLADSALNYNRMGKTKKAIELQQRVLDYRLHHNYSPYWIASAYINMGLYYGDADCIEEALQAYWQAQRIALEHQEHHILGIVLHNIGNLHYRLREYTQAAPILVKALEERKTAADIVGYAITISLAASAYFYAGDRENTMRIVKDMLHFEKETLLLPTTRCRILSALTNIYAEYGMFNEAEAVCTRMLCLSDELDKASMHYAEITNVHARFLFLCGRYKESLHFYLEALQWAEDLKTTADIPLLHKEISHCYEHLHDLENALLHFKKFYDMEYDYTYKNKVVVVALYERKRREEEVAHLAHELMLLTRQLSHDATFLDKLNVMVEKGIRNRKSSKTAALLALMNELHRAQNTRQDINAKVEAQHRDFFHLLAQKYPSLSSAELKICSMLRMNLSSKEIAERLCLSSRTVDSHRRNIRKKTGIAHEANLCTALISL